MGGYGAWAIASNSARVWAAIGIHAGALWYVNYEMLREDVITKLANVPTYFVVGTNDGLYRVNQDAYNALREAGNQNLEFVTFEGGHEKLPVNVENMYLWLKEFVNTNVTESINQIKTGKNQVLFYPNPVRSTASILLNLEKSCPVKLELFDIQGRKIATILDEIRLNGESAIQWETGKINPGIYLYTALVGNEVLKGKLVIK
jgi:hypothetical protein